MADKYSLNRNKVASSPAAGLVVVNPHVWDVEISSNGDKVFIGELPAYHRLHAEGCSFIANGSTGALNADVCVESDANAIFDNVAVTAATFGRTAMTTYQLANTLGVSPVNRPIYLLLNTAPTVGGGQVIVTIASYASN